MTESILFPVTLTETALSQVLRIVAKDGRENVGLRVGVKGGGCSGLEYITRLETELRDNDLVQEIGGLKLICDSKSAKFLEGAVLNYTGNLIGGGFKFENPLAERSCGCGTSFTPKTVK